MIIFVLLALAILPLIEIALIIQIGSWLGLWPTILLMIATSILGAFLLKRQGHGAIDRFRQTLNRGQIPAKETADGGLITAGGLLLLLPGFVSDIIGLTLLIAPSRNLIRSRLLKADQLHERLTYYRLPRKQPHWDVEGEVIEEKLELQEKVG